MEAQDVKHLELEIEQAQNDLNNLIMEQQRITRELSSAFNKLINRQKVLDLISKKIDPEENLSLFSLYFEEKKCKIQFVCSNRKDVEDFLRARSMPKGQLIEHKLLEDENK